VTNKSALIERLAAAIRDRQLTGLATVALEVLRPLCFLGGQVVLMLGPLLGAAGSSRYAEYADLLEDRQPVDQLLAALAARPPDGSAPPSV